MQRRTIIILLLFLSLTLFSQEQNDSTYLDNKTNVIDADKINKGHNRSVLDVLNGQSAGLSIGNRSNNEAMLSSVRLRGTTSLTGGNEPLVIIDGAYSDLRTLSTIYPADIATFNILKDASETAQYGSRGAAGVIEVTTKASIEGKFHIMYNGEVGFSKSYKTLQMLSADKYRNFLTANGYDFVDKLYNTDFQNAILRTGFVQNHHIAFGGGAKSTSYRASIGYQQENAIVKGIGDKTFTAKLDIIQKAFNNLLQIDLGVFGSSQLKNLIADEQKLFYSSTAFNPTFPKEKVNGAYLQYTDASQINHPLSLLDIDKDLNNLHFNTHLKLHFNLPLGFALTGYASYSFSVLGQAEFYPTTVYSHGKISRSSNRSQSWLTNLALTYKHEWNGHTLDAKVLTEWQEEHSNGFYVTTTNLSSNNFSYNNIAVGSTLLWSGTGSTQNIQALLSFTGRMAYDYKNRYSLTLTLRTDASSLVGKSHRWGLFPSASASWNIKNESFLKEVKWLSALKIQANIGRTGNLGGITAYQTKQLYEPIGIVEHNSVPTVVMGITHNANEDLRREISLNAGCGMQIGFIKQRFVLSFDYYHTHISDMLYSYKVPEPPFVYNRLLANLGKMENEGIEMGIACAIVEKKDWNFNLNVNLAWQRNKLLSLSGTYKGYNLTTPDVQGIAAMNGAGMHGGNDVTYQIIGQPLGVFYLPHCNGLKKATDGTYSYDITDDKYIAGQAMPKVMMGANISLRYKWLDLSIQINGAFGHKIYNGTALAYNNLGNLPFYNVLDKATEKNINDQVVSDYYLERGDYANIDYLTLGFNVPLKENSKVRQIRMSLSVNNLCTLTSYSGLTPLVNSSVMNSTLGLDDKRSYPLYRTYTFAFSIIL
ncbi:MAG: SusC/RagA family TonB-linked outer membrane protein [Paludibacteraceae bacterium]|nr:SusC/RagA family TonB-linked outer membrane protein [Paludibacteraceae bacterium]